MRDAFVLILKVKSEFQDFDYNKIFTLIMTGMVDYFPVVNLDQWQCLDQWQDTSALLSVWGGSRNLESVLHGDRYGLSSLIKLAIFVFYADFPIFCLFVGSEIIREPYLTLCK